MTTNIEFTPGRYCPIVGSAARLFDREEFALSCDTLRDLARKKNQHIYDHCLGCGAEIPEAAEFIAINRVVIEHAVAEAAKDVSGPVPQWAEMLKPLKIKETVMEKKEEKKKPAQVCELCGLERKLKKHLKRNVCTSCQFILTSAKLRPETLRAALEEVGLPVERELHGEDEIVPHAQVGMKEKKEKDEELLTRIQLLEEKWTARIEILERMAKRIGAVAGLAGFLTTDARQISVEDLQHHSV